ncbi:AfsR/SARP family transcriptional regulator [Streptomyces sp. NPDC001700]
MNLLGPLEVVHDGVPTPLGAARARTVLGFLLLHPNETVSVHRLTEALWPVDVPSTARKMVRNAVSALRGVLSAADGLCAGSASVVSTARAPGGQGYQLRVDPEHVDLERFSALRIAGERGLSAGDWELASRTLSRALALWRGDVLADFTDQHLDWPERQAVREEWWAALEGRITADLALGRDHEVIRELSVLLEENPEHAHLAGMFMLALYRRGRQVDALSAYRRTRSAVAARTGHEPCRELQRVHTAVLSHAPSLIEPFSGFRHHQEGGHCDC